MLENQFKNEDANRSPLKITTRRKRNRAVQFLLLPAVVFMRIIGWSLCWLGSKSVEQNKIPEQKEMSFNVLLSQENYVTRIQTSEPRKTNKSFAE